MDAQVFSVFAQELVKEAVTVEDLYRGVSSAKNVNLKGGPITSFLTRSSAVTFPTTRQTKIVARDIVSDSIDNVYRRMRDSPIKAVRDQARTVLRYEKPIMDNMKLSRMPFRGKIIVNPRGVNTDLATWAKKPKLQTPEAQKALTSLVASHELAERGVDPKNIQRFSSHFAPEVLLKERNAIARLEGPGAREAVDMMAAARERTGEAQQMRNLLTNAYGPRAVQFLEGNEKVPKAMLRNLRRRFREGDLHIVADLEPGNAARKAEWRRQFQSRLDK